jgi:hypothetical protein
MTDENRTKDTILKDLKKHFREEADKYVMRPILPEEMAGKLLFYMAVMVHMGLENTFDYWISIAKQTKVDFMSADEFKKGLN